MRGAGGAAAAAGLAVAVIGDQTPCNIHQRQRYRPRISINRGGGGLRAVGWEERGECGVGGAGRGEAEAASEVGSRK